MIAGTVKQLIAGAAGDIEIAIDAAKGDVLGVALVAHPHPLFGGTMDNKVAQTLAKTLNELGYITVRPNFRGAGKTAGVHDNGMAEQEDTLRVIDWMRAEFGAEQPLVLAGFSAFQRLLPTPFPACGDDAISLMEAGGFWRLSHGTRAQ